MRVTLLTQGSRGDVQPYVGLGAALAARGHEVTVAVSAAFERFVRRAGLRPFVIDPDPRLVARGSGHPRGFHPGLTAGAARLLAQASQRELRQRLLDGFASASQGADVILYPVWAAQAAQAIRRARGINTIAAYLAPLHPTSAFPSPFVPSWLALGSNRLGHWLALLLLRAAVARLPSASPRSGRHLLGADGILPAAGETCLYGYSPALVPRPPDWPDGVIVTGSWWHRQADWRPPNALERFLTAEGRVVYIGFGSMVDRRPRALTACVGQTAARLGCRVVYSPGPNGRLELGTSNRLLPISDVPFDWLFPRVDAIVHHGGAGTTAEAARAGRPSCGVPYFGDQPFWLDRMHKLGAAPAPIPRRRLTADRLTAAIDQCLCDPTMIRRAGALGQTVRAERGLELAADVIERQAAGRIEGAAQP
jgi:sterol 3beta-glucosyltransferase